LNWVELSNYFNKIYNTKIKSIVFKNLDNNYISDYIYYEKNISNHFRSGIPYIFGKYLGINAKDLKLICATSEMSYCFSLILDDVIDNDFKRWKKDTIYKIKGVPYTVSLSIYLNAHLNLIQQPELLKLRLLHNKWLFKSFLLEQTVKKCTIKIDKLKILNEILLLKTTSGIIANLMMVELSNVKNKQKILKFVFEYSAYTGIAGQLKDDITDISNNKSLQYISKNSDIKNKYINYVTLNYSKDEILYLIKFCEEKAIKALTKFNKLYNIKDLDYNYLLYWSKIAYERAIKSFTK